MIIEEYLKLHVLTHIPSKKNRDFIKLLVIELLNISAASKRMGFSRQRGHIVCSKFSKQVGTHLDINFIQEHITMDLYKPSTPWIALLSLIEGNSLSYISRKGFVIKSDVIDSVDNIAETLKKKSLSHSVFDLTDALETSLDLPRINCDDDVLIGCVETIISNNCPTSFCKINGRNYMFKILHHDVKHVLKMIYVTAGKKSLVDDLYSGYVKHLNFTGSTHIMSREEHFIFCSELSNHKGFDGLGEKFFYSNGFVYSSCKSEESPLSSTEEVIYKFLLKRLTEGDSVVSTSEIKSAVSKENISVAAARKAIGASCILVKQAHGKYSLFGASDFDKGDTPALFEAVVNGVQNKNGKRG